MVDGSIGLIKQSNDLTYNRYTIYDIKLVVSGHVDTVVLLSKLKSTKTIEVDLELSELYLTKVEATATYA